jgi:hypothetical protein
MPVDYPPAVRVHRPDCPAVAGLILPQQATREIALQHPNGRPHSCYHVHKNAVGVVETVLYPPHNYLPSTHKQPDATRTMCEICGGTHGVLDSLLLPPSAR